MERREYFEERFAPCERDNFKPNCEREEAEELEVRCTNISNARCVGILAEKIVDCVYLESLQFADKDEVFTIDNFENGCSRYRMGDAVCIDDISLCYDNIGIKDDDTIERGRSRRDLGEGDILVRYDMENKRFSAVPGNGVKVCNHPDNSDEDGRRTVILYDEFEGAIGKTKCNSESRSDRNSRSRVFKQGLRFFVDNLKVRIRGRIGGRPFTATKDYNCFGDIYGNEKRISVNPVEITKRDTLGNGEGCGDDVGLNFTPVNLYGRVGVPSDGRSVRGNIKLEHCLSAECIETTERYGDYGEGYIHATVGYSFLVTHNIHHTTSEEIAVFTNPNGVECRDASRDSSCRRENDYDEDRSNRRCRRNRRRRNRERYDNNRYYDDRRNREECSDNTSSDDRRDRCESDISSSDDRRDRCRCNSDMSSSDDRRDRCNSDMSSSDDRRDRCNSDMSSSDDRRDRCNSDMSSSDDRRDRCNSDMSSSDDRRDRCSDNMSCECRRDRCGNRRCEDRWDDRRCEDRWDDRRCEDDRRGINRY